MKPCFQLAEIQTKDGLQHQGVYFQPKSSSKRAILLAHGLTSTFYGQTPLLKAFALRCEKMGYGLVCFNNRGHDLVASIKKIDKREAKGYRRILQGAAFENFADCVWDIEAGISFLVSQGFSEIILLGASTGANKVCYYAGSRKNARVIAVGLLSPVSDRLMFQAQDPNWKTKLVKMEQLIVSGKGNQVQFVEDGVPMTPLRFVSAYKANTLEDQFDYGDAKPKLTHFRKIKKPLLVLLGDADEYADRPTTQILAVFDTLTQSKKYTSLLLPNVTHSYRDSEELVAEKIMSWCKKV
ncbi:DUF1749 domain-containing protein [Candidatus Microgenomates bacterium]|nr:MAG: DUF1749 domain-containing protein [Candidatus Microgenomates bacterium]